MRGLRDKVAVVTGSSRGIGAATARRLAEEGCKVVVTGRNEQLGKGVVAGIHDKGGTAVWIPADLEHEDQAKRLMDEAVRQFGSLQILVNNAAPVDFIATGGDHPCHEQTTDNVQKQFAAGLFGVFWCCKYALAHMMQAPNAAIVNITTVAAFRGHPSMPAYSMMKGAVNALTMNLAVDYGPDIRCNGVVVGVTRGTETVDYLLERMGTVGQGWSGANITRLGHADDIAASVAFLASEDSAVTTGSFVFVEGGETVRVNLPDLEAAFNEGVPAYKS